MNTDAGGGRASSWGWVTSNCELPNVGAENQTQCHSTTEPLPRSPEAPLLIVSLGIIALG